jgi:urate oxidase
MAIIFNRYGKCRIRLVKVRRAADPHELVDLTLDVQLEGAFEKVYTEGDNSACLATDTMKNTVYAFARQDPIASPESFGLRLANHFVSAHPVTRARISVVEHRWERLTADGHPHPHAFMQAGGERWTAVVEKDGDGERVTSGLENLVVLKTTDSAFAGFPRDRYTTLPETEDRIFATAVTASWKYHRGTAEFGARTLIRRRLLDTFATHDSRSVQHTLHAMARAVLDACDEVEEVTLALPNRHHLLVDLAAFGLDNPNEVFVATDQPYGLIEATVRR